MDRARARRQLVPALLSIATIAVAALAVWIPATLQRRASDRIYAQTTAIQGMLTSMLDQETGLRGYALTAQDVFLGPYREGRRDFEAQLLDATRAAGGDGELRARVEAAETVARAWQADGDRAIEAVSRGDARSVVRTALERKAIMDRFRARIAGAAQLVDDRRGAQQSRAQTIPVMTVALVSALFLLIAYRVILRPRILSERAGRRARRYAEARQEFAETMQMAGSEEEAHALLKHHIERTLPSSVVLVLKRNNSENRLELGTADGDEQLTEKLAETDARSCLSIRYGRRHHEGPAAKPLLSCDLCRSLGRCGTTCVPSLVGGQVIGSVLVLHEQPLGDEAESRLRESVMQAGPILANLRTLARAERRAATDSLTGLPNARAVQDTLTRMSAQSGRSATPLTAIMIDLDRFKALNDDFGHEIGNDVLASAAQALQGALRASDFVGRYGGEEFVALLPDTDRAGGLEAAEKLRATMAQVRVPGVERGVTASLGVASMPEDAPEGAALLRQADRALYRAKELGRNRVESVAQPSASTA
jgi:diguanylate cyclase (GGDEF)-like protein